MLGRADGRLAPHFPAPQRVQIISGMPGSRLLISDPQSWLYEILKDSHGSTDVRNKVIVQQIGTATVLGTWKYWN